MNFSIKVNEQEGMTLYMDSNGAVVLLSYTRDELPAGEYSSEDPGAEDYRDVLQEFVYSQGHVTVCDFNSQDDEASKKHSDTVYKYFPELNN
jgi:hypothetical protein